MLAAVSAVVALVVSGTLAATAGASSGGLHFHPTVGGGTITEPLLLADYLKQIILGPNAPSLPPDLQQQASGSRFYGQYCRGGTRWLCRPDALGGTDLTFAFEQG